MIILRYLLRLVLVFMFVSEYLSAGCEDSFNINNEESSLISDGTSSEDLSEIRLVWIEILEIKELDVEPDKKNFEFIVIWLDDYLDP